MHSKENQTSEKRRSSSSKCNIAIVEIREVTKRIALQIRGLDRMKLLFSEDYHIIEIAYWIHFKCWFVYLVSNCNVLGEISFIRRVKWVVWLSIFLFDWWLISHSFPFIIWNQDNILEMWAYCSEWECIAAIPKNFQTQMCKLLWSRLPSTEYFIDVHLKCIRNKVLNRKKNYPLQNQYP